jgi:hypothetical protein
MEVDGINVVGCAAIARSGRRPKSGGVIYGASSESSFKLVVVG